MANLGSLGNWLKRDSRTANRKRGAYHRPRLAGMENLEERAMLFADLLGTGFAASDSTFSPGDAVPIVWQVANQGFSAAPFAFDVHFFLSQDAFIATDDLFIGSRTLPPGFPAFFAINPVFDTLFLPPETHPFWNGSGTYFLGMVVDRFNVILESNELNNANLGFGFDLDALAISIASAQQADLQGTNFAVNTANPTPGGQLSVSFSVNNGGGQAAGPFQISFFLSTDANITAGDRLLGTFSSGGLAPGGTLSNSVNLTLPSPGDSIYSGGGPLFVGMIIDSGNTVAESNELNNANRGLGLDKAQFSIGQGGGGQNSETDLGQLPATGIRPGLVLKEFLVAEAAFLKTMLGEMNALKKALPEGGDPFKLNSAAKRLISDLKSLASRLDRIGSGRLKSVNLGEGLVLDAAQIELAERGILAFLNAHSPALSSALLAAEGEAGALSFLSNLPTGVKQQIAGVLTKGLSVAHVVEKGGIAVAAGAAAVGLLSAGPNPATPVAAKVAGIALASAGIALVGEVLMAGAVKQLPNDPVFQDVKALYKDGSIPGLMENLGASIRNDKPLKKGVEALQKFWDAIGKTADHVESQIDRYRDGLRREFARAKKWIGNYDTEFQIGGNSTPVSEPMKIKFGGSKKGEQKGSISYVQPTVSRSGIIKKSNKTATFSGHWTVDDRFVGTMKLAGQEFNFSWNFDGERLSGNLLESEGIPVTFSVRAT